LEVGRVVVSIGRLGSSPATADYYLERQAGCEADYYTAATQGRGRWLGDGARALGLTGRIDPAGEDAFRAMLDGRHPNGDKLLAPVLRLHPDARLPAAPLLEAIQQVARDQNLDVKDVLGHPRMIAAYSGLVRRSTRGSRGEETTVSAARAGKLAVAAGLDPHTVYRDADGTDRYAEAVKHAGERVDARRAGVDVTVSAPKSVSFVFGLAGPHVADHVRAAHAAAVEEAWSYLQAQASDALRGHHGEGQSAARMGTDGPIVAAFDHFTSRAGDPQLHTHLVIPNLVHGADGRWSAMDTRALYRHAATASEIYHAVLRGQLTRRLGVAWTRPSRGRPEIAGIPRSLLRMFSTRRQIEAELERAGQAGPAAAQRACLATRPVKTNIPDQSLRDRWDTQTREAGHDPQQLVYGLLGRQRPPALPDIAALQTELLGPMGVTRHATTFDRSDLLQALCQTLPAGLPVDHQRLEHLTDQVLAAQDSVPLLTRDGDGQSRYSTAELLATERRAMAVASPAPPWTLPPWSPRPAIRGCPANSRRDQAARRLGHAHGHRRAGRDRENRRPGSGTQGVAGRWGPRSRHRIGCGHRPTPRGSDWHPLLLTRPATNRRRPTRPRHWPTPRTAPRRGRRPGRSRHRRHSEAVRVAHPRRSQPHRPRAGR
jgi:conjugative relaxase-like TrwC/TraI family protein